MLSRMTIAAGALGVGALTLVGVGSYATDTSQTALQGTIKAGTFQLQVQPGPTAAIGNLIGDANPTGQPKLTESASPEPVVPNGNTLTFNLTNASPGDSYTYEFTVYDVGTLQGQLNTISYSPGTGNATLERQMTVEVQEQTGSTWSAPIHTQAESSGGTGNAGSPVSAATSNTFLLNYNWGPAFLQPHTLPTGTAYTGDESSATFKVTFSFDSTTANNAVEGQSAAPTMTVNGTITP